MAPSFCFRNLFYAATFLYLAIGTFQKPFKIEKMSRSFMNPKSKKFDAAKLFYFNPFVNPEFDLVASFLVCCCCHPIDIFQLWNVIASINATEKLSLLEPYHLIWKGIKKCCSICHFLSLGGLTWNEILLHGRYVGEVWIKVCVHDLNKPWLLNRDAWSEVEFIRFPGPFDFNTENSESLN